MRTWPARWIAVVAVACLASSCRKPSDDDKDGDKGDVADADSDSATARRAAMYEWYNDAPRPAANASLWSPSYMQFMLAAAGRESARWGALLPHPDRSELVSGTTWTNLGPTSANVLKNGSTTLHVTDSGRVRSIVVAGSLIYVATAGGGVWRSADGGGAWTPITESLGSLSVGSLAIDPTNANTLYLGLGDPFDGTGIGIVKSTDGGNTWGAPSFLGDSTAIPQVLVDPTAPNVVLAATNRGLYRSVDGGTSWSFVSIATGRSEAPYVWTLAWTGGRGFALGLEALSSATTGTTDGQVWTSADDGASWTRGVGVTSTAGVGRLTIAAAPSSPQIVYAMAAIPNTTSSSDLADIYKSTNGGLSWTALGVASQSYTNANLESSTVGSLLNGQGWYNGVVIVSPTAPNTVFFGGALLLAKTTDGGTTFSEVSNWLAQFGLPYVHADFHAATFDGAGNLYVGTDGGVFLSIDGGTTYTDTLNVGIVSHLLYSVGSSPQNRAAVIGGMQDNGTRVRESSTSVFDEYIGGDGFGANINMTNAQIMLGSLYYDRIMKSTDGGTTFVVASTGITESNNSTTAPFITRIVAWDGSTTGNEVYTYSNLKVYRSTNYAGLWTAIGTPISTGVIRNIGVAHSNANVIGVVASGGRVFLSLNGGVSWTQVADGAGATALPGSNLSLSDIHFDPTDSNTVYVSSVAPTATANHLWKSSDFGATWTALVGGGLPEGVPVNMIKNDPQSATTLFAGTHLGVYRSTDGGATWSRFGAGMPLVNVTDLYISPDTTLVRAATYGRGFWELGGGVTDDFSISASPSSVSALQGSSATATIATAVTSGSAQTVSLSASGLPLGATASFDPASLATGGSSTLTLSADASTPPGTYPVTISGLAASGTQTTTIAFTVTAPVVNDFAISASPSAVSAIQGTTATTSIGTVVTSGSAETVSLSASGLPAGATAAFSPASVTAGESSTFTLSAGTAVPGSYAITVTGTAASGSHATVVTFTVIAVADDFSLGASPTGLTAVQGTSASTTITTAVTAGTAQTIALSVRGLSNNSHATFAPNSVTAGGSSTLTVALGNGAQPGTYMLTITGTGSSHTHTTTVTLTVIKRH